MSYRSYVGEVRSSTPDSLHVGDFPWAAARFESQYDALKPQYGKLDGLVGGGYFSSWDYSNSGWETWRLGGTKDTPLHQLLFKKKSILKEFKWNTIKFKYLFSWQIYIKIEFVKRTKIDLFSLHNLPLKLESNVGINQNTLFLKILNFIFLN